MHAGGVPVPGQGANVPIGLPGRGGINRGRGDAELTWGAESPGRTDEFEARILPPSQARDPKDSTILGVGAAAPGVDAQGGASGLTEVDASAGKAAWRRRLSPRHRRAVGSFFGGGG